MYGQFYNQFTSPYGAGGYVPQYSFSQPYQPSTASDIQGVRFVKGIAGVNNCFIPLGTKALFMDSEEDKFYIKETDLNNISTVKEFTFQNVEDSTKQSNDFITREEFETWKEQYESIAKSDVNPISPTANGAALTVHENNQPAAGQGSSGGYAAERFDF